MKRRDLTCLAVILDGYQQFLMAKVGGFALITKATFRGPMSDRICAQSAGSRSWRRDPVKLEWNVTGMTKIWIWESLG